MQKTTNYTLKKVIFGITAFSATFFTQMAFIAATSYFLSFGLINWLPVVLVLVSSVAIVNFGFDVLLSKKLSSLGSLILSIIILSALAVLGFYLRNDSGLYLFFVLVVARFAMVVFDTSLTNLATRYVNSRQTRRFLPFVRGVMDGAMLVSSVAIFIAIALGVYIDPLWLIVTGCILTLIGLMVIRRVFEPFVGSALAVSQSVVSSIREGMAFVFKKSSLYKHFAWLFLIFGGILVLFVFVYNNAFSANLSGTDLMLFLASVNFAAVFLRMIFNLKLLRFTLYKIGLANMLLVYPWIMFMLMSVLMFFTESLYLAAILFIFHVFSFYSYVTVATQSMFELVPKRLAQQVFFFIKGVIPSVAALGASLLMWAGLVMCDNNPMIVSFLLFAFTAAALALALRIQTSYQNTLISSLKKSDLDIRTSSVELMGESIQMDRGEQVLRRIILHQNEDVVLRQKAIISLIEIGNPNSIRELLLVLANDKNMRLRYYAIQAINKICEDLNPRKFGNMIVTKILMVDVFHKVYEEDLPLPIKLQVNKTLPMFGFDVLMDFYKRHFSNSPDFVKASIINAIAVEDDRGLITLLEPYLTHTNLEIRAAAIAGLWRFPELQECLMSQMIEIFSRKDNVHRRVSLGLISQLKLKQMDDYVVDLIALQDKKISTLAVITAISLGRKTAVKVLIRKLVKYAMLEDSVMVEFVFRELSWLSDACKNRFVNEIRALSAANFEKLRSIYNDSDKYFDLVLADLFTG